MYKDFIVSSVIPFSLPLPLPLSPLQAKQKVDGLHLQLQNLLYEVMHLQKEISKCLEFK